MYLGMWHVPVPGKWHRHVHVPGDMYLAMCHVHVTGRWNEQVPGRTGSWDISGHMSCT